MSIYDVNYSTLGSQLLPPDKRSSRLTAYVNALLSPLQWLRNLCMGTYRTGAAYAPWASTTTYAKYSRVTYKNAVYESQLNGNTGAAPATSPAVWAQVQSNVIGLEERLQYNGQTIVLTYALNKWFGTTYRQPPALSDVYILNNSISPAGFVVGATEGSSSVVYRGTSSEAVINDYSFDESINFTIYFPSAAFALLDDTDNARYAAIRFFTDKYLPAGLVYNIQVY